MGLADAKWRKIDWRLELGKQVLEMERYRNWDHVTSHAYKIKHALDDEAEHLASLAPKRRDAEAQVNVSVIEQRSAQLVDLVELATLRRIP